MRQTPLPIDWLLLALLVVVWGSSFALSKHALEFLDAGWIMALRLGVAAAVLVPFAYVSGQTMKGSSASWMKFTWLGFIGNAFPFFLITWGMHFVTSGVAGLLMGAIPLFVVVLAHFTLPGERLTLPKAVGFVLGFCGIVVLIGPEAIFTFSMSGDELIGELAVILGCLCYAIHGISAKRLGVEHPAKQSAAVCLTGAAMGLAYAALANPGGLQGVPVSAYGAVAGLGLLPTAFATLLVYRLMARTGPSFVSLSNYLVPVFALGLGALVLGETLDWNVLASLLLILTGIAISGMAPAREKEAQT
ncbi:DMT family transporter [Aestuariivirga sp.]|uniref:DMT family transporter n=1 Tax=Aestuariivirga sp. TaxID=2650926 RepID=UPI003593A67F